MRISQDYVYPNRDSNVEKVIMFIDIYKDFEIQEKWHDIPFT